MKNAFLAFLLINLPLLATSQTDSTAYKIGYEVGYFIYKYEPYVAAGLIMGIIGFIYFKWRKKQRQVK
ncbi:MAG: hypothetical protein AAFY41_05235 [Bacteroidota bacterium]